MDSPLQMNGYSRCINQDPAIWNAGEPGEYPPYERGTDMDVWIKKSDGNYQEGTASDLSASIAIY